MSKIDEILEIVKGNVAKKEEKKSCPIVWILAIVGAVVAVAAIAYAVYRYFNAEVEEELEDDFDEDFDDDFFEDEESDPIIIPKQEPETVEETPADEATEEQEMKRGAVVDATAFFTSQNTLEDKKNKLVHLWRII